MRASILLLWTYMRAMILLVWTSGTLILRYCYMCTHTTGICAIILHTKLLLYIVLMLHTKLLLYMCTHYMLSYCYTCVLILLLRSSGPTRYIYTHTHICTNTHTHIYKFMCIYIQIHARARTHTHTLTHTYGCMYICRHMNVYEWMDVFGVHEGILTHAHTLLWYWYDVLDE